MATNIGPRIGIDGEAEFRKQIENITAKGKALAAEMQAVATSFGKESDAQEKARATGAVLAKQIENQKQIVNQYAAMVKRSTEVKGEDDATTQKWVAKLNSATAELNRLQEQAKDAANATSDLSDAQDSYGENADNAAEKTITFGNILKANLTSEAIIAGIRAISNGVKQIAENLAGSISAAAEYGDNIDKMSQKMGMSSDAYQEWDFIMQHCGASIDSLQSGMKTMATAAETGSDAFAQLGISQEQIASMSQEDLFSATIAALQNVTDETERTYLAGKLLGRGATELGPLLNMSAEETDAMRQQQHDLGSVMQDDAVKAAAAYQDSLQNLQTAFTGVKNKLAGELLPSVTLVMDGVTSMLAGNVDEGTAMIEQGTEGFVSALQDVTGEATSLLTSALPEVATIGGKLLIAIGGGILTNLPAILDAGMQTIAALINGLSDAMPELIGYLPEIVLGISGALLDNLPVLIDAGIALLAALTEGLIKALPELLAYTPTIIVKMASSLLSGVASLASAGLELIKAVVRGITDYVQAGNIIRIGKNIVEGIWNGISGSLSWIKEKLTGWVGDILGFIKKLFGINSPSTIMRDEVGKYLGLGIGEGFSESMSMVKRQMQQSLHAATDFSIPGLAAGVHYAPTNLETLTSVPGSTTNYGGVSINVYAQPGQDVNAIADTVMRKMQTAVERRNAVWA